MLEQSTLYGRAYLSEKKGKYLSSRPVSLTDLEFGPMRPVFLHPVSDERMIMEDRERDLWYDYQEKEGNLLLQDTKEEVPKVKQPFFYYYGLSRYKDPKTGEWISHRYFVRSQPNVTWDQIPDIRQIEIPLTLQRLDYGQVFTYPEKLNRFLANVPSTYVDRYKRPILRTHRQTFPVAMEKVKTKWMELPPATYPKVVSLTGTPYGVLDLEPEHTEEDQRVFEEAPGYYKEKTPRGGSHKLVWLKEPGYKFRYSPGLELLSQTQVTFYGIEGAWISDQPDAVSVADWKVIGNEEHEVTAVLERPDVSEEVAILRQKAEERYSLTRELVARGYAKDPDSSHADYVALYKLYHSDVKPYASQFKAEELPWILEAYSEDVIPHREKHETLRNGLPYLVYLSAIIIQKEA